MIPRRGARVRVSGSPWELATLPLTFAPARARRFFTSRNPERSGCVRVAFVRGPGARPTRSLNRVGGARVTSRPRVRCILRSSSGIAWFRWVEAAFARACCYSWFFLEAERSASDDIADEPIAITCMTHASRMRVTSRPRVYFILRPSSGIA